MRWGWWRGSDFTVTNLKLGKPPALPTRQTLQSTVQSDFPRALLVLKYKGRAYSRDPSASVSRRIFETIDPLHFSLSVYFPQNLPCSHTFLFLLNFYKKKNSDLLSLYPYPSVKQFPTTTLSASPVLSSTTHTGDMMQSKRDTDPALTPLTI